MNQTKAIQDKKVEPSAGNEHIIERLLDAADNHGEDNEPDDTVGDLQELARAMWIRMTPDQQRNLLASTVVESLLETGARGEFDQDDLLELLC